MIRIAFVIPTLDQSGAERQLTLLACGLPRDQYQVRVFALNRSGYFAEVLAEAGIPVEVLQKRFRFDPLTWWRLRSRLAEFQPQIVQSYLFSANSYVRLPGVCPPNTRVIVSERCVDTWKSAWQLALDQRLIGRTTALTANSQAVADFYREIGFPPERICVIPNGIDIPGESPDRNLLRQVTGLAADDRIVGYVGRLAAQKRLPDLIWSFQLLHQIVDRAKLVIIGSGPERDRLAALAEKLGCRDRIVFTGHREDAYNLMAGFDVFCLPSEFEGMSNSLMEAMSLGIPVVVSDIAANTELVTHNETGLVFPTGQSPRLTEALKRILTSQETADQLSQAARRFMMQNHSVQQLIARHQELYEHVLRSDFPAQNSPGRSAHQ